jgi:hypothetical protein
MKASRRFGAARVSKRYTSLTALTLITAVPASAGTLYDQSVAIALEQRFASSDVSYLVSRAGQVVAARWSDLDKPIPVGSLVKPLAALAYGAAHQDRYPEFQCHPKECWRPQGHGRIGITGAIASSCNSYFLQLMTGMHAEQVSQFVARYGVAGPPDGSSLAALIGLGESWRVTPSSLLHAYSAITAEPIRKGLLDSGRSGTGRAVGQGAYVKTGTAPCQHSPKAPGDGYALAMLGDYAVLVQVHSVPGAKAAVTAGQILRLIREGK